MIILEQCLSANFVSIFSEMQHKESEKAKECISYDHLNFCGHLETSLFVKEKLISFHLL